jgi:hypothetical protein
MTPTQAALSIALQDALDVKYEVDNPPEARRLEVALAKLGFVLISKDEIGRIRNAWASPFPMEDRVIATMGEGRSGTEAIRDVWNRLRNLTAPPISGSENPFDTAS